MRDDCSNLEGNMTPFKIANAEINNLRFVFDDAVISMGLPAGATLEDVACSLSALVPHHDDPPVAIDLTLARS
jgi:hypothetical protein